MYHTQSPMCLPPSFSEVLGPDCPEVLGPDCSLPPSFSKVLGPDCPEVLGPDCSRIDKQKSVFYVEYCHYRSERTIEAK